jgi:hypothetical protein
MFENEMIRGDFSGFTINLQFSRRESTFFLGRTGGKSFHVFHILSTAISTFLSHQNRYIRAQL